MADAMWPGEDAGSNEQDDNGNEQDREVGSGPLVDPAQITSTLSARLVRRWTLPLGRHRERHERGDTDEVETLSPSDAHLLGRFLAQPPTGFGRGHQPAARYRAIAYGAFSRADTAVGCA